MFSFKVCDSCDSEIVAGKNFKQSFYWKKTNRGDYILYINSYKTTYFYKEIILYPFASLVESKNGLNLLKKYYMDITDYDEKKF